MTIIGNRTQRFLLSASICILFGTGALGATPDEDLMRAIARNRKADVEKAIAAGANINATNPEGDSPLIEAARLDRTALVELLASKGANINAQGKGGDTALHRAAQHYRSGTLEMLLEKGAGPNIKNEKGDTPLFTAVAADRSAHIPALIKKGSETDARDSAGDTPLIAAVRAKKYRSTAALLEAGVNRNAVDAKKHTALRISLDLWVPSIINLLATPGTDVDIPDTDGNTAVHTTASWVTASYVEKIAALSKAIDTKNAAGETPLVIAVRRYRHNNVGIYAKRGANVNAAMADGLPVLSFAVSYGLTYVVRALRAGKLNVDVQINGEPAIVDAALKNRAAIVTELIAGGASPNTKTKTSVPVLLAAYAAGRWDSVTTLVKAGADLSARDHNGETALLMAARMGHPGNVQMLLGLGADPNTKNAHGDPVLVAAAEGGNTTVLARILEKTPNIDVRGALGDSALIRAVREGHDGAVALLLSKGANANLKNATGDTALNAAMLKGREGAFRQLVKAGADIRTKDAMGNTLLIEAARTEPGRAARPVLRIMEELLKAGLRAGQANNYGSTALSVAMNRRNTDALELLLKSGPDLNQRTPYGHTIFHQTILSGLHGDSPPHLDTGPETIRAPAYLLYEHGTFVDTADKNGRTPLIHAVRDAGERNANRAVFAVQLLLDLGASLTAQDRAGKTAADYAANAPDEVKALLTAALNTSGTEDDYEPLMVTGPQDDMVLSFSMNEKGTAHAVIREGETTSLLALDSAGRIRSKEARSGLQQVLTDEDGRALLIAVSPGSEDKSCKSGEDLQLSVARRGGSGEAPPEFKLFTKRTCKSVVVKGAARTKDGFVVAVLFGTRDQRLLFFDADLKLKSTVNQGYWDQLLPFGEDGLYLRGSYTYHYKNGRRQWARKTAVGATSLMSPYTDGDILVARTGPRGTMLVERQSNWFKSRWYRIYAGTDLKPRAAAVDAEGNAYIVGTTAGPIHANRSRGKTDLFVMKIDREGRRLWTRQFGTAGDDDALDVQVVGERILVFGRAGGSLDGHAVGGGVDAFVVKFSPDGKRSRRKGGLFGHR